MSVVARDCLGRGPHLADHGKLAPTVFTNDDVLAILGTCNQRSPSGLRDAALIAVVYSGALRIHEALDLVRQQPIVS